MRLIDADALEFYCAGPFVRTYKECREAIREATTVDAVPVVRCKICKHFDPMPTTHDGFCGNVGAIVSENWFCADGEAKSNAPD